MRLVRISPLISLSILLLSVSISFEKFGSEKNLNRQKRGCLVIGCLGSIGLCFTLILSGLSLGNSFG